MKSPNISMPSELKLKIQIILFSLYSNRNSSVKAEYLKQSPKGRKAVEKKIKDSNYEAATRCSYQ